MGGNDSIKPVNYIISVLACINYIKASFIWFSPCHQGDNYLMIFFSVVTAAASGSHWGYKGLNGNVYIYIYIHPNSSHTKTATLIYQSCSYNFNTKNCLRAWMECTYNIFINWYTIFITRVYRMTELFLVPISSLTSVYMYLVYIATKKNERQC